ncbi:hypothetical protein M2427_008478 [Bradyrhizobium sp. BR13661]|jgi:hypothetical protein|nr:hypothetical protein [Bradyrhizobium sp. BR13661]
MRRKHHSEHDQLELFRALPSDPAPRDARDLMAYPFFSLAKKKRIMPIDFRAGAIAIRVEAVPEHGMATIWDADVLIWAASQIVEARDAGLKTSRLMAATPHEILTFVGRGTSASDYDRLKAGLDRPQSTTVLTSIRQPTKRRRRRFSWPVLSGTATLMLSGTRSSCHRGPQSSLRACFFALSGGSDFTNQKSFGFLLASQAESRVGGAGQRRSDTPAYLCRPYTLSTEHQAHGRQLQHQGLAS